MNPKVREAIKQAEGSVVQGGRHRVYKDTLELPTIGYGRLLSRGLSEDEAQYLLDNDIRDCEQVARRYPWFSGLNEPRQAVVVELLYNLGEVRFAGFKKTIAALEAGNFIEASREMRDSTWAKQVKSRADRMCRQMLTGAWE